MIIETVNLALKSEEIIFLKRKLKPFKLEKIVINIDEKLNYCVETTYYKKTINIYNQNICVAVQLLSIVLKQKKEAKKIKEKKAKDAANYGKNNFYLDNEQTEEC